MTNHWIWKRTMLNHGITTANTCFWLVPKIMNMLRAHDRTPASRHNNVMWMQCINIVQNVECVSVCVYVVKEFCKNAMSNGRTCICRYRCCCCLLLVAIKVQCSNDLHTLCHRYCQLQSKPPQMQSLLVHVCMCMCVRECN